MKIKNGTHKEQTHLPAIKYNNSNETIARYKARLVVLGNKSVKGQDYNETFAPVAKMMIVRTFLAVAAAKQW